MEIFHGIAGLGVAGIFVICVFGVKIVKTVFDADIKKRELMIAARQNQPAADNSEIKALREDLMAFKDASTKYDVSLDQILQRLEHRIERLEQLSRSAPPAAAVPDFAPSVQPSSPSGVKTSEDDQVQMVGRQIEV